MYVWDVCMYVHMYVVIQFLCYLLTDGLLWECKLCGKIVPKQSKLKAGSVRLEVKLRKRDPGTWSDYCGRKDSKVRTVIGNNHINVEACVFIHYIYAYVCNYVHICTKTILERHVYR